MSDCPGTLADLVTAQQDENDRLRAEVERLRAALREIGKARGLGNIDPDTHWPFDGYTPEDAYWDGYRTGRGEAWETARAALAEKEPA